MVTPDGKTYNLGIGGEFDPLPQGAGTSSTYSPVYVPNDLYQRFKSRQVRLEVDYSSTLMSLADGGAMAALSGRKSFASIGKCTTRVNAGETEIVVRCLQPGSIPLCTTAVLRNPASESANPTQVTCLPNYAALYPMMIPDGMSRFSAELSFRDANGMSDYPVQGTDLSEAKVEIGIYTAADHLRRHIAISNIRLEDWLPR